MNKNILHLLLPITSIALIGGGIASSLVLTSCGNKTIILRSKREIDKYLKNNSQNCNYFVANIDETTDQLTEPQDFYNFILPHYTKQAFINGIISHFSLEVKDADGVNVIITNNLITLKAWRENLGVKFSYEIGKWSALNDCAIFISGSGGLVYPMTINPDINIENYYGSIKYTIGYERPSVDITLNWGDEVEDEFLFFLSMFDFTNIDYEYI